MVLFVMLAMPLMSGCAAGLFGAGAGAGVGGVTYVMGKPDGEMNAPVLKAQRATKADLQALEIPFRQ